MSKRSFGNLSDAYNAQGSTAFKDRCKRTIRCTVFFLDGSHKSFEIDRKAKGQVLLDLVFQHLELVESDYFSLKFSEPDNAYGLMRWLDGSKCLRKQIKTGPPYVLYFRVKFYVCDPSKLHDEYTRYHLFLQVKKDIRDGRLLVPSATSVLLASYAVQSELGDYNPEEHKSGYLNNLHLLPSQTEEIEMKITELHRLHKGQTPAEAEYNFLDHAKKLDMYGVDLHTARVRDSTNADIKLGVAASGLVVFQNNIKINAFSWAKIVKISFKRKQFFIQLRREGTEKYDNLLGFNMLNYRSCKNLWKSCVEHHSFFRLHAPRPPARHLLFSIGSKFHYSGRTEYQTLEDGKYRAKKEKIFKRSHSRKYARLESVLQTAKEMQDIKEGRPAKPAAKLNGATVLPSRKYDSSFSYRVQVSEPDHRPRKAWAETPSAETIAFTPSIPSKLINYADDDVCSDLYEMSSCHSSSDAVPEDSEDLVTIKMKPDKHGQFGFNVKGGADQHLPILVSRVVPNTAADKCIPRLNEGDQVLLINNREVSGLTHEQVVKLIRCTRETPSSELLLTVRQNVYMGDDVEEPDFQYIPDAPHVSSKVPRSDVLSESILLLSEGLESGALLAQFEHLYRKKPGMTMNTAKLPENLSKNRYRDISPYDSTRVVLSHARSGDYINASHIKMEIPTSGIVNHYIAAQGPLPGTALDFWQMVWEQRSVLIVMLTALKERGRVKCHKYWPARYNCFNLGTLSVTCIEEEESDSFAYRELILYNHEIHEERRIRHMQYLSWPDHGVPTDSSEFLDFVMKVRKCKDSSGTPVVVHCSAGIGRTGVLILMETAMCLIEANESVYPLDIVKSMRDQRAMLIQTTSQYKFVCEAVLKVYNDRLVKPLSG